MRISSASDFRQAARRRLPRFLFDYIDGAAYAEHTARRNVEDLADLALRQRVLVDVSKIDLTTTLFGARQALPVMLGPVGLSGMYARRGEAQAARAASAKGVPICLSSVSVCGLAEVAAASTLPVWFQLYVIKDRGYMAELLDVARELGCAGVMFTVDLPVPGARYRDLHSGMSGPNARWRRLGQALTHPRWAWDVGLRGRPHGLGNFAKVIGRRSGLEDYVGWIGRNFDASINWRDIDRIREHWSGPLVIKGILDPDDAKRAVDVGADGIVVSNHGGRQLDGVLSSVRALPPIVETVGDRTQVLVDGGVRSGLDVVRMLALGAKGVLLGRAWAYALAAGGGKGVTRLLNIFESEMRVAMALTGVTDIASIDRNLLA
ncbi:MAG TPA: FMN-dependent L-lactate dehydrogenase LldD [Allosphingosinicella sp.]|jgi:L-lactate dehydrogenase (cytochrome)|nr:FMN-dependent L-lactate dehydrogenase LldD [Allosphingosinicella sp.]